MSIGLIALLDDVISLTKVAAASLDDVAAQAGKAGAKAAGVVIDDAAVTPRYVMGFSASRELPIVWKIAKGSLRNKLVFLLPGALALSFLAPWAITPLLMLGGAYLSYEGAEKVLEAVWPHQAQSHEAAVTTAVAINPADLEHTKVASAIKTDFILSAEIMAITLASLPAGSVWMQALLLAVVGTGITALVYGGVGLIVKMDDAGLALASSDRPLSSPLTRGIGRGIVKAMPLVLRLLGIVGTAAMIWVGGGILVHGLETFGVTAIGHAIEGMAARAAAVAPMAGDAASWIVSALGSGLAGLVTGGLAIATMQLVACPILSRFHTKADPA
ncbi:MAG: DUF808 domain-containing protein [Beijerinckiaceae bacterium]|nr:DUF808 domain-containing protein [Beijerinckiaceae bacterium]